MVGDSRGNRRTPCQENIERKETRGRGNTIRDFFKRKLMANDTAAATSLLFPAMIIILVASVVIAFILFRSQIGTIGLGFISAVVGFFSSIPTVMTNAVYAIGGAITTGFTNLINGAFTTIGTGLTSAATSGGTGISNAFQNFWKWLTSLYIAPHIIYMQISGA